jgi:hypothetical protein
MSTPYQRPPEGLPDLFTRPPTDAQAPVLLEQGAQGGKTNASTKAGQLQASQRRRFDHGTIARTKKPTDPTSRTIAPVVKVSRALKR